MIKGFVDTYYTYRLLKILSQSWENTPAFKAGIIDVKGNRVDDGKLSDSQKKVYTSFDRVAYNLKRVVSKVPGSQNPFLRMATALSLLKEDEVSGEQLDELVDQLIHDMESNKDKIEEDTPVNNSGDGKVAYTEVPMRKKPLTRKSLSEFIRFS